MTDLVDYPSSAFTSPFDVGGTGTFGAMRNIPDAIKTTPHFSRADVVDERVVISSITSFKISEVPIPFAPEISGEFGVRNSYAHDIHWVAGVEKFLPREKREKSFHVAFLKRRDQLSHGHVKRSNVSRQG